jgi:sugar lactone lactonase YvrE
MAKRLLPLVLLVSACGGSQPPAEPAPAPTPAETAPPVAVTPAPPPAATTAAAPAPEPPQPTGLTPVVRYTEGIATPESVLYDEATDRYLVSNINGKPTDIDNNGYITELSPDGKVLKAKFIAGGVNDVKLNAPKGMTIVGGILYVSDVSTVRKFDAKTGASKGEVAVPGSTFLNDVASSPDGRVFIADSGIKPGANGFDPTGTDAVYVIDKGKLKPLVKSKELGGPNGLVWTDKGLLVDTFNSNEVYRLDDKGVRQDITKLPEGGLDGIIAAGDKLFVTSWKASAVYSGKLNDKFEVAIANVSSPADIGYDTKRNRVLVPRFMENTVEVYEVK